jgi:hypothetical protein
MSYTAEERETHITTSDDGRTWKVYTLMPTIITKLSKVDAKPYRIDPDGGHWYKDLKFNQVSFRSGKEREMSEEQKLAASDRFKRMHEAKKKGEIVKL